MDPFDDSILCHLDQPTRHQTRLAQSTSRVERPILFVFDLEVLSPEETGLRPNLNDTQHVPPISTPHWPVFWRRKRSVWLLRRKQVQLELFLQSRHERRRACV